MTIGNCVYVTLWGIREGSKKKPFADPSSYLHSILSPLEQLTLLPVLIIYYQQMALLLQNTRKLGKIGALSRQEEERRGREERTNLSQASYL